MPLRRILVLLTWLCSAEIATAGAPSLLVEHIGDAFAIFLDGGDLNRGFETLSVRFSTDPGQAFQALSQSGAQAGDPLTPGTSATFISRSIDRPFDQDQFVNGSLVSLGKALSADGGGIDSAILGGVFDTSVYADGRLFLANLVPTGAFNCQLELYSAGNHIARLTASGGLGAPVTTATELIPPPTVVVPELPAPARNPIVDPLASGVGIGGSPTSLPNPQPDPSSGASVTSPWMPVASREPTLHVERLGDAFAIYLDGGGLNQGFETLSLRFSTDPGQSFQALNPNGAKAGEPLAPGTAATFISRSVDRPFDQDEFVNGSLVSLGKTLGADGGGIDSAILGGTFDTSLRADGRLFLANLMPTGAFDVQLELYSAGNHIAHLTASGGLSAPITTATELIAPPSALVPELPAMTPEPVVDPPGIGVGIGGSLSSPPNVEPNPADESSTPPWEPIAPSDPSGSSEPSGVIPPWIDVPAGEYVTTYPPVATPGELVWQEWNSGVDRLNLAYVDLVAFDAASLATTTSPVTFQSSAHNVDPQLVAVQELSFRGRFGAGGLTAVADASANAAVPEPTAVVLAGVACAYVFVRRWRELTSPAR